jgi:hypothetical protein
MYTSKSPMRLTRTFTGEKIPFTTVGDKYRGNRESTLSRHKSRQFVTATAKRGVFFSKTTYATAPFVDAAGYLKAQPRDSRKNGFGSSDAKRRDEFTLTIATSRYREQLQTEKRFLDKGMPKTAGETHNKPSRPASAPLRRSKAHVFDMAKGAGDDSRDDVGRRRPHFTATARARKAMGAWSTSSSVIGAAKEVQQPQRPEFAGASSIRGFYDIGHVE